MKYSLLICVRIAGPSGKILVMVKDERTCIQLHEYLQHGGSSVLFEQFRGYVEKKAQQQQEQKHPPSVSKPPPKYGTLSTLPPSPSN